VKTKHGGHIEVVQDENDILTIGYNVFQLGELVELYCALSNL
jgi:hypothetical protein